jgi:FMN phosphatase YigB (HAD superfamily)
MIKAVIFDYGYTLYDRDEVSLYSEVNQVINDLFEQGYKLALVSRAEDVDLRREEIREHGLDDFFEIIDIVPKESEKEFNWIFDELEVKPEEVMVVGDRVKSEISVGNSLGCMTVWVPRGPFVLETPKTKEQKPDFTIKDLTGVLQILNSL